MSWKSVELQVALPRTLEQSRTQQIMQHGPQLQNQLDGEQMTRQDRKARASVTESAENAKTELRDRQGQSGGQGRPQSRAVQRAQEEEDNLHPFMGHKLDLKM